MGLVEFPFLLFVHNSSTTVSYNPDIEPKGPEIKCNSSCIIKLGGDLTCSPISSMPKKFLAFGLHDKRANLSIVAIKKDGFSLYKSSSQV